MCPCTQLGDVVEDEAVWGGERKCYVSVGMHDFNTNLLKLQGCRVLVLDLKSLFEVSINLPHISPGYTKQMCDGDIFCNVIELHICIIDLKNDLWEIF